MINHNWKQRLESLYQNIDDAFAAGHTGSELVRQMSDGVDQLLIEMWHSLAPQAKLIVDLIAVGGYGRGELAPRSDWDVCLLMPEVYGEDIKQESEAFIRALWDTGAKVGASTRTVKQMLEGMREDLNTATATLESRLLTGPGNEYAVYETKVRHYFKKRRKHFVENKLEEMSRRHNRTGNTAFLMEPDIKENRGGLRDIHGVFWLAMAWYGEREISDLQKVGAISAKECDHLLTAQDFLWRCRTFMHLQGKRGSDRLSFEMQAMLADAMGYTMLEGRPSVEVFMKEFFRHSGRISRVTSLLMMHFNEQLQPNLFSINRSIGDAFSIQANMVSVQHADVFKQQPLRLLEIFHVAQQGQRRLSSTALRQVRTDVLLIDDDFRANSAARDLLLAILRHPRNVATVLREMNDTGVLGRVIPAFRDVVGLGQFNRYHAYTVDEHTLRAIAEARNFFHQERSLKLPLANEIALQLRHPELLYIALLFHDIAKGKQGDHSKVGSKMATEYCKELGLNEEQGSLVSWLVREHLTMAITSQRFDLSDADIIQQFADRVSDQEQLNYLFLLTVADITAVGPSVWNAWKGDLLVTLYEATSSTLLHGSLTGDGLNERVRIRTESTLKHFYNEDQSNLREGLKLLPSRALMHFSHDELLLLAQTVQQAGKTSRVNFLFEASLTMFAIVAEERCGLFARLAEFLSSGYLNVLRAQAFVLGEEGQVLDVFYVRGSKGVVLVEDDMIRLQTRISTFLTQPNYSGSVQRHRYKHHMLMEQVKPRVRLLSKASSKQTVFEVAAADRPGLLAQLANTISKENMLIRGASATTFGERAVDVFFVNTEQGELLGEEIQHKLRLALLETATIPSTDS